MARKWWRKNGTSWSAGKGLWGKRDGSWQVAKKAWVNSSGTWTQVWPPDMAFSAFNVVATTAEAGYTSSAITWTIDTSVPGTVTIQRLEPGGAWTDLVTGLAPSAGTTTQVLTPGSVNAGTWTYRAKFVPTWDTGWLTYSSTDTVSVTIPTFSAFNVTATTGEIGYTTSLISWTLNNASVTPGTVTIQRLAPGGSWADWLTGLAKTDSTTQVLVPLGGQAGTWTYRAKFVPTDYPAWLQYSSTDTITATNPSLTYSVTATSGEVYYTSSSMSWTVTSGHAGTVTLQRKLGTGGTWTDFAAGLSKSSSGSYMLAPAGAANNGTWYYRAKFIPTVDPSWVHYSSEDNATLSFRTRTAPTMVSVGASTTFNQAYFYNNYAPIYDDNSWLILKVFGMSATDRSDVVSLSSSFYGWQGINVGHDGALIYTEVAYTDNWTVNTASTSNISVLGDDWTILGNTYIQYSTKKPIDWSLLVTDPGAYDNCPYPFVYMIGFNEGPNNVTTTVTFSDGNSLVKNSTFTNGGRSV